MEPFSSSGLTVSVVIPALNEERVIGACIANIMKEPTVSEIIVADGGSEDDTVETARGYEGVLVVTSGRGRGEQMNAGAGASSGEALVFLHADTTLEDGWAGELSAALEDSAVAGGAFSLKIGRPELRYRLVERWVKFRSGPCGLPYGDQAIFIRRSVFEKIGGYRPIPIMEDVDLVGRMKAQGTIAIVNKHAVTSARRWERKGLVATALQNQAMMLLYRCGVDPRTLYRYYYR